MDLGLFKIKGANCMLSFLVFFSLYCSISWLAVAISYSLFYLVDLALFLSQAYLILVLLGLTQLMSQFLVEVLTILGLTLFNSVYFSVNSSMIFTWLIIGLLTKEQFMHTKSP